MISHGDFTEVDVKTILTDVSLVETPEGFVEYRGSLYLWPVDSADAALGYGRGGMSVFIQRDGCLPAAMNRRPNGKGLDASRVEELPSGSRLTEFCDRANGLRISLESSRPLTDQEIDQVRVDVRKVGPTLAAMQRGERP